MGLRTLTDMANNLVDVCISNSMYGSKVDESSYAQSILDAACVHKQCPESKNAGCHLSMHSFDFIFWNGLMIIEKDMSQHRGEK